jgi:rRNA maturation endonuclease Nob1
MTQETQKKRSKRSGQVRCQNCFVRFRPPHGAEKAACPECGFQWYISWSGELAKVRKPVWENWERQLAEAKKAEEE